MTSSEDVAQASISRLWLPYLSRRSKREGRVRLFCFPYAGGSASAYYPWLSLFPDEIEVCPVQLPGREGRLSEPPFRALPELLAALREALLPHLDRAFAFFGHSMGALVCFELARYLRRQDGLYPVHLFASGCRAPQQPHINPGLSQLADATFIARVQHDFHSIPPELQANQEMMEIFLPMLRADYTLTETYAYQPAEPLPCPITAYGGWEDTHVSRAQLEDWAEHTRGTLIIQMFPGGHFFLRNAQASLVQAVAEAVNMKIR